MCGVDVCVEEREKGGGGRREGAQTQGINNLHTKIPNATHVPVLRWEACRRPAGRSILPHRPAHPPPYAAQGSIEPSEG